jgi:hypothetical protein
MKGHRFIVLPAISAIGGLVFSQLPTQSVQLPDGTTSFVQPPSLLKADTTENNANTCIPTNYYFTIAIPANAGEPLGKVVITPDPAAGQMKFNLNQTTAFEGTRDRKDARIGLGTVSADAKTQTITVPFNPPVAPGKTVTISLSPQCNPSVGVYMFGVTAYPTGAAPNGQFLDYGRLSFYSVR